MQSSMLFTQIEKIMQLSLFRDILCDIINLNKSIEVRGG